jgi:radical SAM protein with 4Fe4S-binding SPASM domain
MSKETFKLIFDKVELLFESDNNLHEIEWEAIGGETTMMPFEWWEEMLPWALDRISKINKKLKNPGSLNFLTNLIYVDQRYTALFNQYADHPAFCLYTSWEPDTDRFGKRSQLYQRWKETLLSINAKNKILDIILTKKVIELGASHLVDEFVPLGITDFSIKMLSPYGSGKSFFTPNMIDFASMRDFLIELDKVKPAHITYTPQEEMMSSIYRGTSFQCNGNFKYDLSIEPDGKTHFNANQTAEEAAIGFSEIFLEDVNWPKKVMLENKIEENAKLSLSHPECNDCKYMTYCNSGWYHYKVAKPELISAYSIDECPGYKQLWEHHEEKVGSFFSRSKSNHIKRMRSLINQVDRPDATVCNTISISTFSGDYERFIADVTSYDCVVIDVDNIFGKTILEMAWFLDDLGVRCEFNKELLDSSSLKSCIIEHHVSSNWSNIFIPADYIWETTSDQSIISVKLRDLSDALHAFETKNITNKSNWSLTIDDRYDELIRWVASNRSKIEFTNRGITYSENEIISSVLSYIKKEKAVTGGSVE